MKTLIDLAPYAICLLLGAGISAAVVLHACQRALRNARQPNLNPKKNHEHNT